LFIRLEADEFYFQTGVVNRPPENFLAASANVGHVDAEHFQAILELFQSEVILVQHDWVSLVSRSKFDNVSRRLETDAVILGARVVNGDKPDFLAANTDIRHVDAEHFQAVL
jgi:hypothetical protein